jgi:hypothetical protein
MTVIKDCHIQKKDEAGIPEDITKTKDWLYELYGIAKLPKGLSKKKFRKNISFFVSFIICLYATTKFQPTDPTLYGVLILAIVTPILFWQFVTGLIVSITTPKKKVRIFNLLMFLTSIACLVYFISALSYMVFLLGEILLTIFICCVFIIRGIRNEDKYDYLHGKFQDEVLIHYLDSRYSYIDDYEVGKYRSGPMSNFEMKKLLGTKRELSESRWYFAESWNTMFDSDLYSIGKNSLFSKFVWSLKPSGDGSWRET